MPSTTFTQIAEMSGTGPVNELEIPLPGPVSARHLREAEDLEWLDHAVAEIESF